MDTRKSRIGKQTEGGGLVRLVGAMMGTRKRQSQDNGCIKRSRYLEGIFTYKIKNGLTLCSPL